jgi:hypothetical protein
MMSRAAILPLVVAVAACAGTRTAGQGPACPATTTPEGVVCAFYTRYLVLRPAGLPTAGQQASLAPWISGRLEARLDEARRTQTQFRAQNPGEKPPLVDGFLFASLFEGPTSFTVEAAASGDGITRVPVKFRYGTETAWQDVAVLVREGPGYVIDDIEFAGAGPFNPAGRLSDVLDRAGE